MFRSFTYRESKISYSITGKGDTILFVHGFCEDASMWNDFAPQFEKNYQVITLDLPGYGQSSLSDHIVSIADQASMIKALLDAEKIDQVSFIGHSMGGYIASAFAELYPGFLSRLVMFHSHPFEDSSAKKNTRTKAIQFVKEHGVALFVQELFPKLFGADFKAENKTFIADLIEHAGNYPVNTIVHSLAAMLNRPDRSKAIASLPVPVLFIIGKEDTSIPYTSCLQQTHLPAIAQIHLLADTGHMGMYEKRSETLDLIEKFCTLTGSPSSIDDIVFHA